MEGDKGRRIFDRWHPETTLPFVRGEFRYTDPNRKHAKIRYAHGSDTNRGVPTVFWARMNGRIQRINIY